MVLVLDERRHVVRTLRLWGVVFASNVFGAFLFALLAGKTSALRPDILSQLVQLGQEASTGSASHFFWSGIIGGWLIALVAWTVTASHWTIGQIAMVYLLTFVVGIGHFAHCIAGSAENLSHRRCGGNSADRLFSLAYTGYAGKHLRRRTDGESHQLRASQDHLIPAFGVAFRPALCIQLHRVGRSPICLAVHFVYTCRLCGMDNHARRSFPGTPRLLPEAIEKCAYPSSTKVLLLINV